MIVLLTGFDCAGVDQGEEGLGKVRRTLRGSKGSLTSFHRSPQRSDALATVFAGFYRMSAGDPTGNSGFLQEVC